MCAGNTVHACTGRVHQGRSSYLQQPDANCGVPICDGDGGKEIMSWPVYLRYMYMYSSSNKPCAAVLLGSVLQLVLFPAALPFDKYYVTTCL